MSINTNTYDWEPRLDSLDFRNDGSANGDQSAIGLAKVGLNVAQKALESGKITKDQFNTYFAKLKGIIEDNNSTLQNVQVGTYEGLKELKLSNQVSQNGGDTFDLGKGNLYIVQPGDTLTSIAKKTGMTLEELIGLNAEYLGVTFDDKCSVKDVIKSKGGKWCNKPIHSIMPGETLSLGTSGVVEYDPKTKTLIIPKTGLKGVGFGEVPEGFKQFVKDAINPYSEKDNLAILLDFSGSTTDDRTVMSRWTSEMGIPRASVYTYSEVVQGPFTNYNEAETKGRNIGNGGTENVVNAIEKAITDGETSGKKVTRIIAITDEKGDDWVRLNQEKLKGVKITTILINDGLFGATCKSSKYGDIGVCTDAKPE